MNDDRPVIVIGGGAAGLVAARDLKDRGIRTLLLEARDRLGGRMWRRPFAGSDRQIELGGRWVAPDCQRSVDAEIRRHGLRLEAGVSDDGQGFHTAPERWPVPTDALLDLERATVHIRNAAARIDPTQPLDLQPLDDLDVSWREFLAPLRLGASATAYLDGCASAHTGRSPAEAAAIYFLEEMAAGGLTTSIMVNAADMPGMQAFAGGTTALVEALAGGVGGEVDHGAVVTAVRQLEDQVLVTLDDGTVHRGAAAVLAIPINCWDQIEFDPPLDPAKLEACRSRPSTVERQAFYALVRKGPSLRGRPTLVLPIADGQVEVRYVADLDGGQLVTGAGRALGGVDLLAPVDVAGIIGALMPGAELVRIDGHSWAADPYARGDWASYVPGILTRLHSDLSRPSGRIAFAGADIAPHGFVGWIDGAIDSGRRAAAYVAGFPVGSGFAPTAETGAHRIGLPHPAGA